MQRLISTLLLGALLALAPQYAQAAREKNFDRAVVHTIYSGQTLGKIAKRYNIPVAAILTANGLSQSHKIKPKQRLVIPSQKDQDGKKAAKLLRDGRFDKQLGKSKDNSARRSTSVQKRKRKAKTKAKIRWRKYARPARRPGYVVLKGTGRSWSGFAIVKGNRVPRRAHKAFRKVLASWRTGESIAIDPQLIRLIVKVSDRFGGRPLKIVSGFRKHSYARASRHKHGRAVDLSIPGVPNEALAAYLYTLPNLGVGAYPNSTFVHVDVRATGTQWTDYSRAGEAPQHRPKARSATATDSATP
ncbi:MAG: DUF882 domain-containing protein [Polyangiaceae bacterium]|nr:DUF882 domain-containing protein [Polyangiaceae bacterium]